VVVVRVGVPRVAASTGHYSIRLVVRTWSCVFRCLILLKRQYTVQLRVVALLVCKRTLMFVNVSSSFEFVHQTRFARICVVGVRCIVTSTYVAVRPDRDGAVRFRRSVLLL
jgi:ABC-type uncharacterized transport system permease subunit